MGAKLRDKKFVNCLHKTVLGLHFYFASCEITMITPVTGLIMTSAPTRSAAAVDNLLRVIR